MKVTPMNKHCLRCPAALVCLNGFAKIHVFKETPARPPRVIVYVGIITYTDGRPTRSMGIRLKGQKLLNCPAVFEGTKRHNFENLDERGFLIVPDEKAWSWGER